MTWACLNEEMTLGEGLNTAETGGHTWRNAWAGAMGGTFGAMGGASLKTEAKAAEAAENAETGAKSKPDTKIPSKSESLPATPQESATRKVQSGSTSANAEMSPVEGVISPETAETDVSPEAAETRCGSESGRDAETNTDPTDAQKEAGNYKKGRVNVKGLDIAIENPKGSVRKGKDADGKEWEVEMPATYGYVERTEGKDGDQVDVYVGENMDAPNVYVVDQVDADSKQFDEHKAFIGFESQEQVEETYDARRFPIRKARTGAATSLKFRLSSSWHGQKKVTPKRR